MSKLIDALKASAKEFQKKGPETASFAQKQKSDYSLTQEQLADIYFSGSEKARRSDTPLIIKVIEKPRSSTLIPWIISSVALLIMSFSLFSTKKIFIDIKVIEEKSVVNSLSAPLIPAAANEDAPREAGQRIPLEGFIFEGASKIKSQKDSAVLTLVNSSIAPFARANFYFPTPLDLSNSKIIFYAKGQKGGENLSIALKDRDNVIAFEKGKIFPFPNNLSAHWQMAEIQVVDAVKKFDQKRVASLRFDFGSKDTNNKSGDTIFIKDMQIVAL